MKTENSFNTKSDQSLLISEEEDKIHLFKHQIEQVPDMLRAVLRAYGSINVKPPLTIEDIEYLIGKSSIEGWLRSRIVENSDLPKIGEFGIEKEGAKKLLSLPDYSGFEFSLSQLSNQLSDSGINISQFFDIEYAGENGRVGLVRIKNAEVEKELERYRLYVAPSKLQFYKDLKFVVDFLNKEVVAKSDEPFRSPTAFTPKIWENAKNIQELFKFNYILNSFEINLQFFKELSQSSK